MAEQHYRLFQLPHNSDKLFSRLQRVEDVDLGEYVCVWHDTLDHQFVMNDLEDIYVKFNMNHPGNFGGHSLSISDIIEVFEVGEDFKKSNFRYFYCDSFGWAELPIKK